MVTTQDTRQIEDLGLTWQTAQNNMFILLANGNMDVEDLPWPDAYREVDRLLFT